MAAADAIANADYSDQIVISLVRKLHVDQFEEHLSMHGLCY